MKSSEAKTTAQVLREARELISDPECWWDGGEKPGGRGGGDFCALTAIEGAGDSRSTRPRVAAFAAFARAAGIDVDAIPAFNDSHSHGEVLVAFDRAIEIAEAEA